MFDAPLDDILTRNAERPEDDRVPEDYIRRQAERYGLGRSLVCGEVVRRLPAETGFAHWIHAPSHRWYHGI